MGSPAWPSIAPSVAAMPVPRKRLEAQTFFTDRKRPFKAAILLKKLTVLGGENTASSQYHPLSRGMLLFASTVRAAGGWCWARGGATRCWRPQQGMVMATTGPQDGCGEVAPREKTEGKRAKRRQAVTKVWGKRIFKQQAKAGRDLWRPSSPSPLLRAGSARAGCPGPGSAPLAVSGAEASLEFEALKPEVWHSTAYAKLVLRGSEQRRKML